MNIMKREREYNVKRKILSEILFIFILEFILLHNCIWILTAENKIIEKIFCFVEKSFLFNLNQLGRLQSLHLNLENPGITKLKQQSKYFLQILIFRRF